MMQKTKKQKQKKQLAHPLSQKLLKELPFLTA
jgi:hypothetical protein